MIGSSGSGSPEHGNNWTVTTKRPADLRPIFEYQCEDCAAVTTTGSASSPDHCPLCNGAVHFVGSKPGAAKPAHDPVNPPSHYCLPNGLECIDVIEALGLSFHLANAFKYLWRAGRKADAVEDIRKAIFYLQRWVDKQGGGGAADWEVVKNFDPSKPKPRHRLG